jgi:hypothetical protein
MPRLKRVPVSCLLACVLSQSIAVHAATYYVSTTGNDSNPGTSSKPWQTVAYATATMKPGDTTYVRSGIYKEGSIRFSKSGTQSAPIKLLNAPGESPIVDCIDKSKFHRILLLHPSGPLNPIGWITIEGFEIRNCYNGIKVISGHDLTIRRNWIHHNTPGSGILGNGTRVLIDRNIINHNGDIEGCKSGTSPCSPGSHGVYFNGTSTVITNNVIYDNLVFGLQLNGSTASSTYKPYIHPSPEYALSENWVIAHNTFAYSWRGAGVVVWGFSCNNARIENNTFYENGVANSFGTQGVHFTSTTCTGITIRNNLFYTSRSGVMRALGAGAKEGFHYSQSGNIVDVSPPGFINAPATLPASPNFALTARSPAIDAGLALPAIKAAFDGTLRPQGRGYDIGAYEYSADSDTNGPSAPVALQVR